MTDSHQNAAAGHHAMTPRGATPAKLARAQTVINVAGGKCCHAGLRVCGADSPKRGNVHQGAHDEAGLKACTTTLVRLVATEKEGAPAGTNAPTAPRVARGKDSSYGTTGADSPATGESGAVPKFTLKRLHQIVAARYFSRSTESGTS